MARKKTEPEIKVPRDRDIQNGPQEIYGIEASSSAMSTILNGNARGVLSISFPEHGESNSNSTTTGQSG